MTNTHEHFRAQRFFPALDGVRAVSALLVLVYHLPEQHVWSWLRGYNGYTVFFVLSGFLITTLCLRDLGSKRGLSLSSFYTRRIFRIVPLYALTIAGYAIASWVSGDWPGFQDRLVFYVTFNGEFIAGPGYFSHSWTLGVEEKFYVVWPVILGATAALTWRSRTAGVAGALGTTIAASVVVPYASPFASLLAGCLLALLLDDRRSFAVLRSAAANRSVSWIVLAFAVVAHHLSGSAVIPHVPLVFPLLIAACLGGLLLRPSGQASWFLSASAVRWVGRRSYGVYLVHGLVIQGIGAAVPANGVTALSSAMRLVLAVSISLVVADVLHRAVERPCIRSGRALALALPRVRSRLVGVIRRRPLQHASLGCPRRPGPEVAATPAVPHVERC